MARPYLTAEQRAQTRETIRSHALALYREGGLDAVSLRSVAARAGLSPASIYSYFPTIRILIESLWRDPIVDWLSEMHDRAHGIADPVERLRTVLDMYLDFALHNPDIYQGALMHVRPTQTPPPDVQSLNGLPLHVVLRDAIRDAQALGAVRRGDADLIAQSLWAALHGTISLPVHMEAWGVAQASSLYRETCDMLLRGLQAEAD